MSAEAEHVIIAGGGIGGLTLALTLNQIGVPCTVIESSRSMKPIGVGINLQPNAIRELFDLGITEKHLDEVGLPIDEWALMAWNGKTVYSEPRGFLAGYKWPQYAVHRGRLHMLLYNTVLERLGQDSVILGTKVIRYEQDNESVVATLQNKAGEQSTLKGTLLIGADGIHSAVRAQMHPDQPPIHWGGKLMWRGTVNVKPLREKPSFIGLGSHDKRLVLYPISRPNADGLIELNWIAEVTQDNQGGWPEDNWFQTVAKDSFIHHFEQYRYDWLDVPEMLKSAECAYENPMIDRDPIPTWIDGRVALMGDAAHAMYPTGSNGASQAIVDCRVLGAQFLKLGVNPAALKSYDDLLCKKISELVLRNRGEGPFGLLTMLEERTENGEFDDIEKVLPENDRETFMAGYKKAAGLTIDTLNNAPATIPEGSAIGSAA